MDQQELKNILEMHRKWVMGEDGGKKADLHGADLRSADLRSADLHGADLRSADLHGADLRSADLRSADLRSADLHGADLRSADLYGADLRSADLYGADLRSADLYGADLRSADLRSADLSDIKKDFFSRLALAKNESIGLYDALKRGKINGSAYEGDCACFCGTIANLRKENYKELTCGLKPESNSPTEKWFLGIKTGETPESNVISKVTVEWLEEFIKDNGFTVPQYKLISSLEKPEIFVK